MADKLFKTMLRSSIPVRQDMREMHMPSDHLADSSSVTTDVKKSHPVRFNTRGRFDRGRGRGGSGGQGRTVNQKKKIPGDESELRRENIKLKDDLKQSSETVKDLEESVTTVQTKLTSLEKTLEEKENSYQGDINDLTKKNEYFEEKLESYEKKLLLSNIDPVTLEVLEASDDDTDEINRKRELARTKVLHLKERLDQMNQRSTEYINELQNLGSELDKLKEDNILVSIN